MSNTLQIQCSNPQCQSLNSFEQFFCQQCGTPIVKRYLRAISTTKTLNWEQVQGDGRYIFTQPPICVETQLSSAPYFPESLPNQIIPYLQLFPYRLNIPQVYGILCPPDQKSSLEENIWLLDYGTLVLDEQYLSQGKMFPLLREQWQGATIIRKLNWLRQIAYLWNPLAKKGVVSTLLQEDLLAVNGTILQVLELSLDQGKSYSFKSLGQLWQTFVPQTQGEFQDFFAQLCERLLTEKIHSAKQLLAVLNYALEYYGRSQEYNYQIFTLTDSGPTRDHNEDACYPAQGTLSSFHKNQKVLTIVCDGIGGHEGGEVASGLAIETLKKELDKLDLDNDEYTAEQIIDHLQKSIFTANTKISEVNDQERRQERQRMGTTVVMALAYNHQVYLAHVGDSRIYYITQKGVYQLTLDDDLASREVRLGYALYRDAVRYPSAGALVQALGMGSSNNLHPNIQNLSFDEDCVFLLCSDGLSDFDRVDQYWDKEILALLNGERDLATVGRNLIEIANTRNGHDNATISLLYCQVANSGNEIQEQKALSWQLIDETGIIPKVQPPTVKIEQSNSIEAEIETQPLYEEEIEETLHQKSMFPLVVTILIMLIFVAGLILFRQDVLRIINDLVARLQGIERQIDPQVTESPSPTATVTPEAPSPSPSEDGLLNSLEDNQLYEVREKIILNDPNKETNKFELPENSIIYIVNKENIRKKTALEVCYVPSNATEGNQNTIAKMDDTGVILHEEIKTKKGQKYESETSKIKVTDLSQKCQKYVEDQPKENS